MLLRPTKLPAAIQLYKNLRWLNVGIRREDKGRWECRTPITPIHIAELKRSCKTTEFTVQPCNRRVFTNQQFEEAGATISDDLSVCDVILGVKEVPVEHLLANKTYLFFSHTHKGQRHNMKMLNEIIQKQITLLDYELLRLVNIINCLSGFGDQLLAQGYRTPFLNIGLAHHYLSLEHARSAVKSIGNVISTAGLPKDISPIIFAFTGYGNVTKGAIEMFKLLPHEMISVKDLPRILSSRAHGYDRKIYGLIVDVKDYIENYNEDYFLNPSKYKSIFHEQIAPYVNVIVNGIYWDSKFPRLLTKQHLSDLAKSKLFRLTSIADISCDINGSLEFMDYITTIDSPFYIYDPITGKRIHNSTGKGIQIMSIDNLPTQLPLDSSLHFSQSLFPFIKELSQKNDSNKRKTQEGDILDRACIVRKGVLTPDHYKLQESIIQIQQNQTNYAIGPTNTSEQIVLKKILILGSGRVTGPLVEYLAKVPSAQLTIVTQSIQEAIEIKKELQNVQVIEADVNQKSLEEFLPEFDIVVSFLPASCHPEVAKACILYKKHMVTASYVSPDVLILDEEAKKAGITILNELGLDPGIDHLAAMKVFDEVKSAGGKVNSFVSWCGGLPAPECSDNPFGYKFSWSPKGALLAALNPAKYLQDGKIVEISGDSLLQSAKPVNLLPGFKFEGIPNRDSTKYISLYNIDGVETMFRGTLRYEGYCDLMDSFKALGFFTAKLYDGLYKNDLRWSQALERFLEMKPQESLDQAVARLLKLKTADAKVKKVVSAMNWLGMTSSKEQFKVFGESMLMIDSFCDLLQNKLVYKEGERDLVFLQHHFGITLANGRKEKRVTTLIAYGTPHGYSAMAKTVGLPAAMGTELLMKGLIQRTGVITPMKKDVYLPILDKLQENSIILEDKVIEE